jgi:hypothetical protein
MAKITLTGCMSYLAQSHWNGGNIDKKERIYTSKYIEIKQV